MDYLYGISLKDGVKLSKEIYVKGFEANGISYDELVYLLNKQLGLKLKESDIRNCWDMEDLFNLPIPIKDKLFIRKYLYDIWVENRTFYYPNESINDFRVSVESFRKERHEKKTGEKRYVFCPHCMRKIGVNDNFCCYCGCKL